MDQQSEEVAKGYHILAQVISLQKKDFEKAETLARESLRIRSKIYDDSHENIGYHENLGQSSDLLACILLKQDNLGDETKELMERSLAVDIQTYGPGPNGINTAVGYARLGEYYHLLAEAQQTAEKSVEYLRLSHSKIEKALRINTNLLGPNNERTMKFSCDLSVISSKLLKA